MPSPYVSHYDSRMPSQVTKPDYCQCGRRKCYPQEQLCNFCGACGTVLSWMCFKEGTNTNSIWDYDTNWLLLVWREIPRSTIMWPTWKIRPWERAAKFKAYWCTSTVCCRTEIGIKEKRPQHHRQQKSPIKETWGNLSRLWQSILTLLLEILKEPRSIHAPRWRWGNGRRY